MRVAIIGASGLVGQKLIELLETSAFSQNLELIAASQTKKTLPYSFNQRPIETTPLNDFLTKIKTKDFEPFDIVWIATPNAVASRCVEALINAKAADLIIDGSSAHRLKEGVPLVIPEISERSSWAPAKLISSPNCVATLIALVVAPLHKAYSVCRIQGATYQSASGGGRALYESLLCETQNFFSSNCEAASTAFNIYPHESPKKASGLCGEEEKIIDELRYFLNASNLPISMRSIRVPTLHAHGVHLTLELQKPFTLEQTKKILSVSKGVCLLNHSASALDASGNNEVLVSDIRLDPSSHNSLELWLVGDQLLKGSALNMLQIAELSARFTKSALA